MPVFVSVPAALRDYQGDLPYQRYTGLYYHPNNFKDKPTAAPADPASHIVSARDRVQRSLRIADSDNAAPAPSTSTWHVKNLSSERECLREVIALEYRRLLIPGQPKTRWHVEEGWWKRKYRISSEDAKEVVDGKEAKASSRDPYQSQSLGKLITRDEKNQEEISVFRARRNYVMDHLQGLGAISIAALLTQESDLNLSNLIWVNNRIVNIDGDHALGRITNNDEGVTYDLYTPKGVQIDANIPRQKPETCDITLAVLQALPDTPKEYSRTHWLDPEMGFGSCNRNENAQKRKENLQPEIFCTLLCALILPDHILHRFVFSYVKEDRASAQQFFEILLARKQQAQNAAANWKEFQVYLQSEQANADALTHITYLSQFCTADDHLLLNATEVDSLQRHFTDQIAVAGLAALTPRYNPTDQKDIELYKDKAPYLTCFRLFKHPLIAAVITLSLLLLTAYFPPLMGVIGAWSWASGIGVAILGTLALHPLPSRLAEKIKEFSYGPEIITTISTLAIAGFAVLAICNPFSLSLFTLAGIFAGLTYLLMMPTIMAYSQSSPQDEDAPSFFCCHDDALDDSASKQTPHEHAQPSSAPHFNHGTSRLKRVAIYLANGGTFPVNVNLRSPEAQEKLFSPQAQALTK